MSNIKVKVTNINYAINEKDFGDQQEYFYTKEKLPNELELEFYFDEDEQEFEEILSSLIEDETDFPVCSFEFQII